MLASNRDQGLVILVVACLETIDEERARQKRGDSCYLSYHDETEQACSVTSVRYAHLVTLTRAFSLKCSSNDSNVIVGTCHGQCVQALNVASKHVLRPTYTLQGSLGSISS